MLLARLSFKLSTCPRVTTHFQSSKFYYLLLYVLGGFFLTRPLYHPQSSNPLALRLIVEDLFPYGHFDACETRAMND